MVATIDAYKRIKNEKDIFPHSTVALSNSL